MRHFLQAKIHRATVTRSDLNYEGSVALDPVLMEAARIAPFEAVALWNVTNGERVETYAIPSDGPRGDVCVNGAAAHKFECGDLVIIASFCWLADEEIERHQPVIVLVDECNRIKQAIRGDCVPA